MSVTAFSDVSKAWGLAQVENDDDAQELLLDSPLPTTRPSPTSSIDAAAVTYSTGHMQRPMAGAGEASEPPEAGPHGDAPGLSEDATRASGAGPWNCLRSCSSGLLDVLEPSASDPALQELGMEPEVRETQALSFTMPEMRAMPRAAKAVRPQLAAGDRQVGAGPHDSAASSVSPTGTELLGRRSSSRVFQQPADDDSPGTTARPAQATQDAKGATAAAQSSHPPSELFARSAKADSLPAADAAPVARPLASSRRWLEAALSAVPSSCGAAGERRGRESRGLEGRSSLEKALAALAPSQSARSGGAKPADSWTQLLSMLPGPAFDSAAAPRRRRDGDGAADGEDLSAQVSLDVKGVAALADGMPEPLLLPAARPLADIGMAEASHGSSGSAAAEEPLCTPFSSADGPPAAAAGGRHGAAQSQQELDKMSSSMDLVQRAGDAAPAPKPPLHLQLHSAFRASPPGDTLNRILSEPLLPADDGVSSTGPEPSLSSTLCSPDCQRSASASIGFDDSPGDSAAMSSPGSSCRSRWKKSVRILTKNGLIVPSRARAAAAASLAKRQEQPTAMSVGGGVDVAAPDLRSPPTESSATSSAWHRAAAASADAKPPASGDLRAQQSRFSLSALADSCRRSSAPKQGGELLAELVGKLSQLQMTPSGAAAGDGAEALSRQQLGSYSSSTSLLAALSPTQSGTTPRIPLAPASGPGGPGSQLACIDSRSHSAGTGANSDGHGESLPNVEGSSGSSGKLDRLLDGQQRLMETVTQLMHRVEALTRKVDHLSAGTSVSNAQILAEPGRPSVSDDILRELKR